MNIQEQKDMLIKAMDALDERQKSYIDEFRFVLRTSSEGLFAYVEGWYAGELLAFFDGNVWEEADTHVSKKLR